MRIIATPDVMHRGLLKEIRKDRAIVSSPIIVIRRGDEQYGSNGNRRLAEDSESILRERLKTNADHEANRH